MRPKFIIFVLIAVACAASFLRMAAQQNDFAGRPQSVGLVLSGGGAKGIAHIGVIQALEDNNIPIDYISGTSMGAIVGSLYACGYTPEEMMALIESKSFANWSTGVIDPQLSYYFLQDDPLPTLLTLNFGDSDSTKWKPVLPSSLINPLPMNFAFMELYAPYTAQCGGDFNKLFVPFRCVSSDMTNKRMVVSGSGSLGDAVRASMSFPLVFHPIERNGALLYDGGIYDNFPVDVMRDSFAPQIMIGVDVATTDAADDNKSMVSQLETMIIQRSDYSLPANQGIKIRIHLEQFGLLDFNKARQIYKMGYDKAMEMMDSIRSRVTSRIAGDARRLRREVFKSQTPWLRFDSVSVVGGSEQQREYIESLFTRTTESDTFGLGHARDGFYRAITPGKFKNLEPEAVANDSSGLFTLNLRASMKNRVSLGIGGFLSTATNSMLFLSGAYKTLSFNSLDLRLNGWLGQSYLAAEVSGHIRLLRHQPSSLQINAVASRQKYFLNEKMFYQTSEPTALVTNEYFGRLSYGLALGRHGKGDISVGYGKVEHRSYPVDYPLTPDELRISQNLAQARLAAERNTLNSQSVPTTGSRYRMSAIGVIGDISIQSEPTDLMATATKDSHHRNWFQIEAQLEQYWSLSDKISLGAEVDLLYSSRKLLSSYAASLIDAPSFVASPSKSNIFSTEFRANSYGVAGFKPIWKLSSMFQVRATADVFVPLRPILPTGDGGARYGDYLSRMEFFGGLEGVLSLPFANVTAYANYATVGVSRWNFGLSFGLFIKAPGFLR